MQEVKILDKFLIKFKVKIVMPKSSFQKKNYKLGLRFH